MGPLTMRPLPRATLMFVLVAASCAKSNTRDRAPEAASASAASDASRSNRVPRFEPDNPLRALVEGEGLRNACQSDSGCVRGGCAGEVCSAETAVRTDCGAMKWSPAGACGCVDAECQWYREPPTVDECRRAVVNVERLLPGNRREPSVPASERVRRCVEEETSSMVRCALVARTASDLEKCDASAGSR